MDKPFYKTIEESPRIINDPGMNWGTLYQVSPEEKDQLIKSLGGGQFQVTERLGCMGIHLSHAVQARRWFADKDPRYIPSISEKKWLIEELEEVSCTGEFTGISASAYPMLLERLKALPDVEDRLEYEIHYHY